MDGKMINIDAGSNSPFEELVDKGIYYISGEIEEGTLKSIQEDMLLKHLDPKWTDDITIMVNSVGGDVAETWALIDLMEWVRFDVRTTGLGMCASAGACILAAGTKGKRTVAKNCSVMIHGISSYLGGNKQQIAHQQKYLVDEHNRDVKFWIEHSNFSNKEQIEEYFLKGFDVYLTPEEALKHGIIDEVQGRRKKVTKRPAARRAKK